MSKPHVAPSGPFRDGAVELVPEPLGAQRDDVAYGIRGDTARGHLGNPGDLDADGEITPAAPPASPRAGAPRRS